MGGVGASARHEGARWPAGARGAATPRFGASGDAEPLCTAEAAASLLEQRGGDEAGGAAVRALLDDFQREYAEAHPHLHPHLVQFAARAPGRGLEFRPSRPAGIERTAPAL